MLSKRTGSKSSRMHQAALERLRRAQNSREEYVRTKVDAALTDTFDAWDTEPPAPPAGSDEPSDDT